MGSAPHPVVVAVAAAGCVVLGGALGWYRILPTHPPRNVVPVVNAAAHCGLHTITTTFKTDSLFVQAQLAQWKSLNPGWDVTGYDDAEAFAYLQRNHPLWVGEFYQTIAAGPIRADVFRTFYLWDNGGAWVDIDIVPSLPIVEWGVNTSVLWVPTSHRAWLLNPTAIVACAGDATLKAACGVYRTLARLHWLRQSYHALSIVTILTTLQTAGYAVDSGAREVCPGRDRYACLVESRTGRRLFFCRHRGWDRLAHGERVLTST